ncbi:hypothetical protein MPTK1_3g13130 [Marchantia polymorpha subsp. ruderalis]|uniref:DUF218 domain-containing protein n=2 Tax=Marchantia polymorpha TaxID=3197 RepID=A0AAF6B0A9_MARPO|nr:hypothetical protein MARPO_0050s0105 [Marchantia polymorpha]BBN05443.1 hypothetical protein Mp_3g13130 [Marchantia polymorpha subsp. ruderalis]|eukprot:PTQ38656.1 hypothetical protein MARPO_0050s0105 [Marchantia polymorpha]
MPIYAHFDSDSESGAGLDLELGVQRRPRRRKSFSFSSWARKMFQSVSRQLQMHYKLRPFFILCLSLAFVCGLLFLVVFYDNFDGYHFSRDYELEPRNDGTLAFRNLRNLVMVAGHAVYTSSSCSKAEGEDSWFLESYQKHPGQASTFVEHIKTGVEVAAQDEHSLLLFSGGETRKEAGPRSEAQSYWLVAESKDWFGKREDVRDRSLTEEHARDSFENLLFSVCRFREITGTYPINITVVSYDFKEYRFANLHRSALQFPASRFFFKGTPSAPSSILAAQQGELRVQGNFERDPYGCEGSLRMKRLTRDPFLRTVPYPAGCPELKGLFSYCGTQPYSRRLPWHN